MEYKNNLKVIEHAREELSRFFKTYGFSGDEIKEFCQDASSYNWKNFDYDGAPTVLKLMSDSIGRDNIRNVVLYAHSFLKLIKGHRSKAKYVEDKSVIKKAIESNTVWATSELNEAFPSRGWEVRCEKGSNPYVEKQTGRYGSNFNVDIPIGWGKTVYAEGIATVKAGDGERFVMSAYKKDFARLVKDGVVAYECNTLRAYRDDATIEKGWVLKYETYDDTILATHQEFSRAESLLKRRIKDTVVKELVDF